MSSTTLTGVPAAELRAREKLYTPRRHDRLVATWSGACAALLVAGFTYRGEYLLSPERGAGYALGITGLGAAVALMSYSIRKRLLTPEAGALSGWFRVHIALGILAPTAILLHSNFQLGSLNSTIALTSMLAVATSGFIGRFVYVRIHRGLFGRRRDFRDIRQDADDAWRRVSTPAQEDPGVVQALGSFGRWASDPTLGVMASATRFVTVGWRARRLERAAQQAVASISPRGWPLDEAASDFLWAAVRLARFRGYERVFSLWHAIHVPLCVLMFVTAAVHVVAVHLY